MHKGPLDGIRIVEVGGLGPVPFACMLLADMGAEVVRIERPGSPTMERGTTLRGRTVLTLNLAEERDRDLVLELSAHADVVVEGFRPGVMERLGLAYDRLSAENPGLVYARMTGWGQSGPRSRTAGHDINYVSISGALDAIGTPDAGPVVPLNLVGDYGAGALYLAMGTLAALMHARQSGRGQVVDCAICDGVVSMMSLFHHLLDEGTWQSTRRSNIVDGGAHFYTTYECADGRYVAVGAIEPGFYAELRKHAGLDDVKFDAQNDRTQWPALRQELAAVFKRRTRDEWSALFDGTDACVSPVLTLEESRSDAHLQARNCFTTVAGVLQPAPAPRFSATPGVARPSSRVPSASDVIARWSGQRPAVLRGATVQEP